MDDEIADMVEEGRKNSAVPRFVARIEKDRLSVGLEMVAQSSPLGGLRGTDNQIVFRTRRYSSNPLVVTGPGAGAEVTAAGVLNDVVSIAVSHFGR
jgi:homoserine dehydrogenase